MQHKKWFLLDNNISEFEHYISLAEQTANEIKSPEHLAEIYLLKHDFDVSTQDFKKALEHYQLQSLMRDSVQGLQKLGSYLNHHQKAKRRIAWA